MTNSTSTSRNLYIALVAVALLLPTGAQAAVKITDALYNPAGADGGREWIQITNTGTEPLSLTGYKLFEGGVNHKLTVVTGTSTIAAGATSIIATDPGQYAADHPTFSGTLFKSSFSLSNTGETIALKDSKLQIVDTYTYTAPLVVKEPTPKKEAKARKSKTSFAKSKNIATTYVGDTQAASAAMALPALPQVPKPWLYALGVVSLLMLGVATVLYIRPSHHETSLTAGEFNIE